MATEVSMLLAFQDAGFRAGAFSPHKLLGSVWIWGSRNFQGAAPLCCHHGAAAPTLASSESWWLSLVRGLPFSPLADSV